jgi:hypothetical protein
MNIEFHYYALHHLCAAAGLSPDDSYTVAGSSQLVDEILVPLDIREREGLYRIQATQNYRFWNASIQREVYLPFHFIPGEMGKTGLDREVGQDEGVVTQDSPGSRSLLIAALRTDDLFRIGIALHAYADTWAHQNFSGIFGRANIVDPSSLLPPAGHLQVLGAPDDPAGVWTDGRLAPELRKVVNSLRFLEAARKIYRFICTWKRRSFIDEDFVLAPLELLWKDKPSRDGAQSTRTARISSYIVDLGIPPREPGLWMAEAGLPVSAQSADPFASGYNRLTWLRSTLAETVFGHESRAEGDMDSQGTRSPVESRSFSGSKLHGWSEAASAHRAEARKLFESGAAP